MSTKQSVYLRFEWSPCIASVAGDLIQVWDTNSGATLATYRGHSSIVSVVTGEATSHISNDLGGTLPAISSFRFC